MILSIVKLLILKITPMRYVYYYLCGIEVTEAKSKKLPEVTELVLNQENKNHFRYFREKVITLITEGIITKVSGLEEQKGEGALIQR